MVYDKTLNSEVETIFAFSREKWVILTSTTGGDRDMEKIGVGIIGLGMGKSMFGIRQIPDTTLEIRGICDTDANRLESIRTEHNVPFATMDYQELLQRDEIDIVGIYTPDPLHAQHCLDALDCGKHIICTKGFVDNLDDAVRVLQRTRGNRFETHGGTDLPLSTRFYAHAAINGGWQTWQYRRSRSPLCP